MINQNLILSVTHDKSHVLLQLTEKNEVSLIQKNGELYHEVNKIVELENLRPFANVQNHEKQIELEVCRMSITHGEMLDVHLNNPQASIILKINHLFIGQNTSMLKIPSELYALVALGLTDEYTFATIHALR